MRIATHKNFQRPMMDIAFFIEWIANLRVEQMNFLGEEVSWNFWYISVLQRKCYLNILRAGFLFVAGQHTPHGTRK